MLRLSIVICTFERPALLERALLSVLAQEGIDHGVELLVVDNSDSGSAQPTVEQLNADSPLEIRYLQAKPANISVARNAGVAAATAPFLAFLDDDQEIVPGWLQVVLDAVDRYDYDVLFGSIRPNFLGHTIVNDLAGKTFSRQSDEPTGAQLAALKRKPSQYFPLGTGNSVFRRASTLSVADPFDPQFGMSGGEDFHLFLRLEKAGCRFGWLPDARAVETVPQHRCEEEYLARRYFAGGQAFAAAVICTSRLPALTALKIVVKARLQLLLVMFFSALRKNSPKLSRVRLQIAGIRGKLCWRSLRPIYREEQSLIKN